jgi:hypothetical protein
MRRSTRNDRFKTEGSDTTFRFFYGYTGNCVPPFFLNGVTLLILFFMVVLKVVSNRGTVGSAKLLRKHNLVAII